jgi:hypothetical protein
VVRNLLRKLIHPLPENLEARIIRAWRLRKLFIIRLWYKLSAPKSFTRYLPADTIYWVNPEKIVFAMNGDGFDRDTKYSGKRKSSEFNVYKCRGRVIGGDWDRLEKRFTELDFYRSYEQRAQKGTSWEQLPYYKRVLVQVENGT